MTEKGGSRLFITFYSYYYDLSHSVIVLIGESTIPSASTQKRYLPSPNTHDVLRVLGTR